MKMDEKIEKNFNLYRNCKLDLANLQLVPLSQNVLRCLEFVFLIRIFKIVAMGQFFCVYQKRIDTHRGKTLFYPSC